MEYNKDMVIKTVKDTAIQLAGFMVGTVASKLVAKAVNKDGTNQMLGNIAPFGVAAGAVVAGGMLHEDAPQEARSFLNGITMGATYQGLVNYGVPAKIETAVGLSGLSGEDITTQFAESQSPEVLFEDEELKGFYDEVEEDYDSEPQALPISVQEEEAPLEGLYSKGYANFVN